MLKIHLDRVQIILISCIFQVFTSAGQPNTNKALFKLSSVLKYFIVMLFFDISKSHNRES